ncbi:MAG: hypothetical protein R3E66_24215 [bacterium]
MSNTHDEIAALIRKEKDNKETILVYYDAQNPKRVVISKEIGFGAVGHHLATVTLLLTSVYSFVEDKRRRRIWSDRRGLINPRRKSFFGEFDRHLR